MATELIRIKELPTTSEGLKDPDLIPIVKEAPANTFTTLQIKGQDILKYAVGTTNTLLVDSLLGNLTATNGYYNTLANAYAAALATLPAPSATNLFKIIITGESDSSDVTFTSPFIRVQALVFQSTRLTGVYTVNAPIDLASFPSVSGFTITGTVNYNSANNSFAFRKNFFSQATLNLSPANLSGFTIEDNFFVQCNSTVTQSVKLVNNLFALCTFTLTSAANSILTLEGGKLSGGAIDGEGLISLIQTRVLNDGAPGTEITNSGGALALDLFNVHTDQLAIGGPTVTMKIYQSFLRDTKIRATFAGGLTIANSTRLVWDEEVGSALVLTDDLHTNNIL